jgi:hypothetical protein
MSKWKHYPDDFDNLSYYSPSTIKELPTKYGYYLIGAELVIIAYTILYVICCNSTKDLDKIITEEIQIEKNRLEFEEYQASFARRVFNNMFTLKLIRLSKWNRLISPFMLLVNIVILIYTDIVLVQSRFSGVQYYVYDNKLINSKHLYRTYEVVDQYSNRTYIFMGDARVRHDFNTTDCPTYTNEEIVSIKDYFDDLKLTYAISLVLMLINIYIDYVTTMYQIWMSLGIKGCLNQLFYFIFMNGLGAVKIGYAVFNFETGCLKVMSLYSVVKILLVSMLICYIFIGIIMLFLSVTYIRNSGLMKESREICKCLLRVVLTLAIIYGFAIWGINKYLWVTNDLKGAIAGIMSLVYNFVQVLISLFL